MPQTSDTTVFVSPRDAENILNADDASALREPFRPEQIGKLPRVTCKACSDRNCREHHKARCDVCKAYISTAHIHLDYVGHAAVTDRLLKVDPTWTWEPMAFDDRGLPALDREGNLWIYLTVKGVVRPGVGDGNGMKERVGDALRNAAMRFGVGLDLWSKEDLTESTPAEDREPPPDPRSELMDLYNALPKDRQTKVLDRLRKAEVIKRKSAGAIGTVEPEHVDVVRRTLEAAHASLAADGGADGEEGESEPTTGSSPPDDEWSNEKLAAGIAKYRAQLSDAEVAAWMGWLAENARKGIDSLDRDALFDAYYVISDLAAGRDPASTQ